MHFIQNQTFVLAKPSKKAFFDLTLLILRVIIYFAQIIIKYLIYK